MTREKYIEVDPGLFLDVANTGVAAQWSKTTSRLFFYVLAKDMTVPVSLFEIVSVLGVGEKKARSSAKALVDAGILEREKVDGFNAIEYYRHTKKMKAQVRRP